MRRLLLVVGLLVLLTLCGRAEVTPTGALQWQTAGPGLQVLHGVWNRSSGGSIVLLAVRADLRQYRLRVLPAGPDLKKSWRADAMRRQSGAVVAVNGPFFDTDGRAMGLVIANGRQLQPMPPPSPANGAVLCVVGDAVRVVPRERFDAQGVTQAVQCAPRLLVGGQPTDKLLDATRPGSRMVLALTSDRHLLMVCTPDWTRGASFADLQDILRTPLFGAVDAMCVDGGASTQMSIGGRLHEEVQARDPVPVGLGLFPRTRKPRTVKNDY